MPAFALLVMQNPLLYIVCYPSVDALVFAEKEIGEPHSMSVNQNPLREADFD